MTLRPLYCAPCQYTFVECVCRLFCRCYSFYLCLYRNTVEDFVMNLHRGAVAAMATVSAARPAKAFLCGRSTGYGKRCKYNRTRWRQLNSQARSHEGWQAHARMHTEAHTDAHTYAPHHVPTSACTWCTRGYRPRPLQSSTNRRRRRKAMSTESYTIQHKLKKIQKKVYGNLWGVSKRNLLELCPGWTGHTHTLATEPSSPLCIYMEGRVYFGLYYVLGKH